jgi:hypothetical protein
MQGEEDAITDRLEALQAELAESDDDARIAELQDEIKSLEAQLDAIRAMPNPMDMWALNDRGVLAFYAAQCVLGLLLNLFMFISGIGLLNYREWGRVIAVWVAGLKLANLLAVAVVTIFIIAPAVAAGMDDFFEQIAQQQQQQQNLNAAPPGELRQGVRTLMSVYGTVYALLGAIYPAICLWQLTRPRVRAACQATL